MKKQSGFTLIELMIVVAIIAIIAAIAIPNLLAARLSANETSAVATLRNLTSCETQFQTGAKADVDRDGSGEFGSFHELSGARGVRTDDTAATVGAVLNPPVLSGSFRTMSANHTISRSGYIFRVYLPTSTGSGVYEHGTTGIFASGVGSDLAERTWCAYSWPAFYGNSGNRAFFVNQGGDITASENSTYSGDAAWGTSGSGTECSRAFSGSSLVDSITGRAAIGTIARDGLRWKQVN